MRILESRKDFQRNYRPSKLWLLKYYCATDQILLKGIPAQQIWSGAEVLHLCLGPGGAAAAAVRPHCCRKVYTTTKLKTRKHIITWVSSLILPLTRVGNSLTLHRAQSLPP